MKLAAVCLEPQFCHDWNHTSAAARPESADFWRPAPPDALTWNDNLAEGSMLKDSPAVRTAQKPSVDRPKNKIIDF
jgi:hypothetical protein